MQANVSFCAATSSNVSRVVCGGRSKSAPSPTSASSSRTRVGASGSANSTVPSATCVAPHATNSSASRPLATPPMPTIGKSRRARARMDRCERDGLQRRAGVAAGAAREHRSQRARVEREAAQRVDEREPVGAGGLDRARDVSPMSQDGRRELRVERQRRRLAARGDDLGGRLGRLVDVRAREVELDRLDRRVERCARLGVVGARRSRRPRPRAGSPSSRSRGSVLARGSARGPGFASPIAFSIPCVGLGDARRRVALARLRRDGLRHEARRAAARRRVR